MTTKSEPDTVPATSKGEDRIPIIGLYGLSGAGKTRTIRDTQELLREKLGRDDTGLCARLRGLKEYEGSEAIQEVLPDGGGLEAFKPMSEDDKAKYRALAIQRIAARAKEEKVGAALVAGHFMFPANDTEPEPWAVKADEAGTSNPEVGDSKTGLRLIKAWTDADTATYTHIIYMDVAPDIIAERVRNDDTRKRQKLSVQALNEWQSAEKDELRDICIQNGIVFALLQDDGRTGWSKLASTAQPLLDHLGLICADADETTDIAMQRVSGNLPDAAPNDAALILDADRTLAPQDTGTLFWQTLQKLRPEAYAGVPMDSVLREIFEGPLGYRHDAFVQAAFYYEMMARAPPVAPDSKYETRFEEICHAVAAKVTMYPELVSLLQMAVCGRTRLPVLIATCGIRRVWEIVLEREGFGPNVLPIIGGSTLRDGYVVSPGVKTRLVARLRKKYGHLHLFAFGDSPVDMGMLRAADRGIVVVGDEATRSRSMDRELQKHETYRMLSQVCLPPKTAAHQAKALKHIVDITEYDVVCSIFNMRPTVVADSGQCTADFGQFTALPLVSTSNPNAAKLLMTPTRDAKVQGPALQRAHRRIGRFLGETLVADFVGLEEFPIEHVTGGNAAGFRLRHESRTLIVALMRAGEPIAQGVNEAFPLATFLHAHEAADVKDHHLEGRLTVIIADGVVNSGATVQEFVDRVRELHATVRVVVVAGVVQAGAVRSATTTAQSSAASSAAQPGDEMDLAEKLRHRGNVKICALRISENKFKGVGASDTGNRLFNTTDRD